MDIEEQLQELAKELAKRKRDSDRRSIYQMSIYSPKITNSLSSLSELMIYMSLELKEAHITRPVLICNVDPFYMDKNGILNIQKMLRGNPPINEMGLPCHLHHIGQKFEAPFAELFPDFHNTGQYYRVLHPNLEKESWRIDPAKRTAFSKEKELHWIMRGELLVGKKESNS